MKIKENDICYYCGKPAVSSEHVPAKCFFPEGKRKNLIEVPACKEHNEKTSDDDSYVLLIITSFINNNQVGKDHSTTKWVDILKRSPALKSVLASSCCPIVVNNGEESVHTVKLEFDRERFDNVIRKVAYALFFHTYQKRWDRQLNIGTTAFLCEDGGMEDMGYLIQAANKRVESCVSNDPCLFLGDNPEVFKYRFLETDNPEEPILQMLFYEGFEVWAFPKTSLLDNNGQRLCN